MANVSSLKSQQAAEEFAHNARVKAQQVLTRIPKMIKEYPVQSLLMGLGLGFVVGMIINRDKSND